MRGTDALVPVERVTAAQRGDRGHECLGLRVVCPAAADCLADEGGRGLAVVEQVVAGSDGRDAQVPVDVADDAQPPTAKQRRVRELAPAHGKNVPGKPRTYRTGASSRS